ncbi:type IV secretory system conjugative DNA transfer family protein [Microcoleus sp. bin38.metabat.b11b12b14.051]|uniref:type IV secretory system conjugative DNA transfer family protein n=1 Tax=Microcoleus sp. bin38.metabat.b11b12b14.051 TaxID=2742709 RepID=UPI0025D468A4|nr:type IV secretory system conjugative DNA transfer family protein [Microcoleus sp. bin38.metabat.b11b12b14.051]
MLINKNQVIVSGILGLGLAGFAVATALQFNDRIEYRISNRIEYAPAWLVPPKAEFKGIERGYGGVKILLSLLATGGMVTVMLIARNEGEQEPIRQKIKGYQKQAYEFGFAAESAYSMAQTQMKYKKLLEADEVAFEGEIETAYCESLGIDTSQQQAALTGTATLDSTTNPSDKIEDAKVTAIEQNKDKLPVLMNYPSVLIYGAPGSGKTTFAEEEVSKRLAAGHRVIVLDPHAAYGAWEGCEIIGGGMNYFAIDAKLEWFAEEVRRRYKRIESEPNPTFQPLTFVCDEFTNWAGRCSAAGEFFQSALSDIRKAKMFGLIVSHTRTLAGLANAAGMAKLRDEALLEIELLGQQCPQTGLAVPRFEALIKLPGEALNNRKLIKLAKHSAPQNVVAGDVPDWNTPNAWETPGTPQNTPKGESEQPGTLMEHREQLLEILEQLLAGTAEKAVFAADSSLEHQDKLKLARLIIDQDLGLEKTIWILWGVRRGGRNHALYAEARVMLERLIKGDGNGNN